MRRILLSLLPCLLVAQVSPEAARIQSFQSTAKIVRRGDSVTLRWSASGASQVRLEPLGLILPAKGEITHLVKDRTIYWLHVSNPAGGQSAPLVVDLLPEEALPVPPSAPLLAPPAELPRLAEGPPPPLPRPGLSQRRLAESEEPRRAWIQFGVTVSRKGAARLHRTLQRVAGSDATLTQRRRRSGRPYLILRSGPFTSPREARVRLRELAGAMQALHLQPIVIVAPAPARASSPTFLADARNR